MAEMVKDPVCGMDVDKSKAAGTVQHQGKVYHFCSPSCKKQFEQNPQKFITKDKR